MSKLQPPKSYKLAGIVSGPATVITSGTVIPFNDDPLEFYFETDQIGFDVLRLEIVDDDTQDKLQIIGEAVDEHLLEIKLINFKHAFGAGTSQPLPIGSTEGRTLYVKMVLFGEPKSANWVLHYTFYLGEDADV